MPADPPFQLGRGATGPLQQSAVTCGSAALTVARMLVRPDFARWILTGIGPSGIARDPRREQDRFAEYERTVMNRTNGVRAADDGRTWQFPWPDALGTPPWGARRELEHVAPRRGPAYAVRWVRPCSSDVLAGVHGDLMRAVRQGLPALLYVGNAVLPRHVTLVLAGNHLGDELLDVYDPATGSVTGLDRERFTGRALDIAGWNVPWITVQPRHHPNR